MKALNITGDAFHPEWNYTINGADKLKRSSYSSEYPNRSSTGGYEKVIGLRIPLSLPGPIAMGALVG